MADFPGNLGQMNAFAGGSNTMTFTLNPSIKECQLVAKGFNLSAATVTVLPIGSSNDAETITMTGMNKTCTLSDAVGALAMRSLTIGGLAAGTYEIGVYQ